MFKKWENFKIHRCRKKIIPEKYFYSGGKVSQRYIFAINSSQNLAQDYIICSSGGRGHKQKEMKEYTGGDVVNVMSLFM